jgi:hypothetical protein
MHHTNSDVANEAVPNDEPQPDNALHVVRPFVLRAVAIWGCFYVLLAQSFAVWKWQTPNIREEEAIVTYHGNGIPSEVERHELESVRQLIPKLQAAVRESQQRNQWIQQQLQISQRKFSTSSIEVDLPEPSLNLQKLVSKLISTGDHSDAATSLNEIFPSAREELNALMSQQKWDTLDSMLAIDGGVFEVTSSLPGDCPSKDAASKQLQNMRFYLKDDEEDIFAVSQDSLPLSFFRTLQSLQHHLHDTMQELYESRTNLTDASTDDEVADDEPRSCLPSMDVVLPWVDVGLDFIRQQRASNPHCVPSQTRLDLRPVLLKAVVKSGVDASDIVLDADMSIWNDIRCHGRPPLWHRRSFRQWLDQPTLHASLTVMDSLLDWLNGKSDLLDDWMDRYIYTKYTAGPSESMISRMLASAVLDIAGHLPGTIDPFNLTSISVSVRSLS